MRLLEERVSAVAGARNAADAAAVDLVADVLDDGVWETFGLGSAEAWVSWQFGVTRHRAQVFCSIARRRAELPTAIGFFGQGRLSIEQTYLIARHCPTAYERDVANFALVATIPQLSRTLRDYRFEPEPTADDVPESPESVPRSSASLTFGEDGRFRFVAQGDAEEGARIKAALNQYHTCLLGGRGEADPYPTGFEAFMALVDSATDADLSTSRRYRHRTLLHIDAETLVDWARGRQPRLHLGPAVDRPTMELVTCEGEVSILVTRLGRPVRLGRSTRVVASWLREIIVERDGGCRVCGSTRNLDIHHVIHWSAGGSTDPSNLATVCSRCHTAHHKGHITISGNPAQLPGPASATGTPRPDGLLVTNQYGLALNRRRPAKPPPDDTMPTGTYRHPLGERLQRRHVHFAAQTAGRTGAVP